MSKITNDGLTQDALHCTHMTTVGIKGLTKSVITKFIERLVLEYSNEQSCTQA